jgi:uncharacterized protein DUF1559
MRDDYDDDDDDRDAPRSRRRDRDRDKPVRRRRRDEDSDDDYEPKRRSSGTPIVLIIAILAVVGICLAVSIVAVVAYMRQGHDEADATITRPAPMTNSGFRAASLNDVKQISQAMQRYHDDKNEFPPPSMKTRDGKPGLSWRVAILPYLGQEDLYRQFKLDEPWDHPDNLRVASKMPNVFGGGGGRFAQLTSIKIFVGKGAIFDPEHPEMRKKSEMKDGPAKTILLFESMPRVNWISPEDIQFDENESLRRPPMAMQQMINVAFADGTVRSMKNNIDSDRLKLWVMPNTGKEKPSLDE